METIQVPTGLAGTVLSTAAGMATAPAEESPDQFYTRVALIFAELSISRPSDTTTALAELADVPFTTAVSWVRKSRERGYLPKSGRQKKGESNA